MSNAEKIERFEAEMPVQLVRGFPRIPVDAEPVDEQTKKEFQSVVFWFFHQDLADRLAVQDGFLILDYIAFQRKGQITKADKIVAEIANRSPILRTRGIPTPACPPTMGPEEFYALCGWRPEFGEQI